MKKDDAIKLLGGTPKKAAEAMGYRSVHAVYLWPEVLPRATADRVRGAIARISESSTDDQAEQLTTTQGINHG